MAGVFGPGLWDNSMAGVFGPGLKDPRSNVDHSGPKACENELSPLTENVSPTMK